MDKYLGKKYRLKTSENFEEYLKFIEIGLINRKTAMVTTPTEYLTKNADQSYTYMMTSPIKDVAFTFKPGEEFIEERADGVKVRSLVKFEGHSLVQTQTENNGRISRLVRSFKDDTLVVTLTADGWSGKCVRTFELVN